MNGIPAFEIIVTTAIMVAGWFLRTLWDNHARIEKRLNESEINAINKFVRRDDYHNDIRDIRAMLDKIFSKLDDKADKT